MAVPIQEIASRIVRFWPPSYAQAEKEILLLLNPVSRLDRMRQ
jgi:hypothetical protein